MSDPTGAITCRELVELVTDYLEGSLPPAERLRFERHLVFCPGCVVHVEQMRLTIARLGALREEAIDPQARDDLLAAFRTWKAG